MNVQLIILVLSCFLAINKWNCIDKQSRNRYNRGKADKKVVVRMKALMKRVGGMVSVAAVAISLFSPQAFSESLYSDGTVEAKLSELVMRVADEKAVPAFIFQWNDSGLTDRMNKDFMDKVGLNAAHIADALDRGRPDYGYNAYIKTQYGLKDGKRACVIVFPERHVEARTVFHEAVHCRISQYMDDYTPLKRLMTISYLENKTDTTALEYMVRFEEALVAHLTVAFGANTDMDQSMTVGAVKEIAGLSSNRGSSYGVRTARHALQLCSKAGSCTTDVMAMAKQMAEAPGFLQMMKDDINELHAFNLKNRF